MKEKIKRVLDDLSWGAEYRDALNSHPDININKYVLGSAAIVLNVIMVIFISAIGSALAAFDFANQYTGSTYGELFVAYWGFTSIVGLVMMSSYTIVYEIIRKIFKR